MQRNENCIYCGRKLPETSQSYKRKYCSITCSNKYRLRQKKPETQEKLWVHDPEIFKQSMEMYWSGVGSAAIARKLNIPVGTMYSWVHDFGGERERAQPEIYLDEEKPHAWSLKECFRQAENAEEWLGILQNTYQDGETYANTAINLVCGRFHGQSAGTLAAVVYEKLKDNPLNGKTYAFCNKCGNAITTISWKEPIYHITRYIKARGTFIWPGENLGKSIGVTRTEFEHLVALQKSLKCKP